MPHKFPLRQSCKQRDDTPPLSGPKGLLIGGCGADRPCLPGRPRDRAGI